MKEFEDLTWKGGRRLMRQCLLYAGLFAIVAILALPLSHGGVSIVSKMATMACLASAWAAMVCRSIWPPRSQR